jgi:CheY-like chemotaxis protein
MPTRVRATPSVLVVDDTLDEREMYARALRASGFQAIEATTFAAAYQMAVTNPLDIVVTNVRIAGSISGLELIRRLRSNARTSVLRIIALTSVSRPQDADLAVKAGADSFLEKPVPIPMLKAEIVRLIALSRQLSVPFRPSAHRQSEAAEVSTRAMSDGESVAIFANCTPARRPDSAKSRSVKDTDRSCPSCGGLMVSRERWPALMNKHRPAAYGDPRERLQYVAGWFCTNPSCDYYEPS